MKKHKKSRRLLTFGRRAKIAFLIFSTFIVLSASAAAMIASHGQPPAKTEVAKAKVASHRVKNLTQTNAPKKTTQPAPKPSTAPTPAPTAVKPPPPKPAADVAKSPATVAQASAPPGNGVSGLSSAAGSPAPTTTTTTSSTDSPSSTSASSSTTTTATPCSNTPGQYSSSNWAGYFKTGCKFTTVAGKWTVPTSTTTSTTDTTVDATWIGIGGVTTNDLIQVGTEETVDPDGTINAAVFYELLPDSPHYPASITVSPGDQMSASLAETTTGSWLISISDLATGKTYIKTVAYTSSYSSVEWIEEDPSYTDGTLVPFDNFGTVNFTSASETGNGTVGSLSDASNVQIIDAQNRALAVPSAVSGTNEDSFSVKRELPK